MKDDICDVLKNSNLNLESTLLAESFLKNTTQHFSFAVLNIFLIK